MISIVIDLIKEQINYMDSLLSRGFRDKTSEDQNLSAYATHFYGYKLTSIYSNWTMFGEARGLFGQSVCFLTKE